MTRTDEPMSPAVDSGLVSAVKQFLYREARLLDNREWEAWLALFAADGRYEMPNRSVPFTTPSDPARPVAAEVARPGELYHFDEPTLNLMARVMKLRTGKAWAEEPPSRTRRFITNIEVEATDRPDLLRVYSNFLIYRSRNSDDRTWLVGSRDDLIRLEGGSFVIERRRAVLDDTVVPSPNLALFF